MISNIQHWNSKIQKASVQINGYLIWICFLLSFFLLLCSLVNWIQSSTLQILPVNGYKRNSTDSLQKIFKHIALSYLYTIRRVPLGQPPECDWCVMPGVTRHRKERMRQYLTNATHILLEPDTDTANPPRKLILLRVMSRGREIKLFSTVQTVNQHFINTSPERLLIFSPKIDSSFPSFKKVSRLPQVLNPELTFFVVADQTEAA